MYLLFKYLYKKVLKCAVYTKHLLNLPEKNVESCHNQNRCNIHCNPYYFVLPRRLKHINMPADLRSYLWKHKLVHSKLHASIKSWIRLWTAVKHKILYVQLLLTMAKSGLFMSLRRWQELVVTELTPAHHSRENSQRSLTTHRFTVTFILRSFLSDMNTMFTIKHGTRRNTCIL